MHLVALHLSSNPSAKQQAARVSYCKTMSSRALGVLPGGGWENLQNLDMGRVINVSYTHCHTTEDGVYLIPDEVFVIPPSQTKLCHSSYTSEYEVIHEKE